jgi:predicted DNA-binding transcriptional regulator YafY
MKFSKRTEAIESAYAIGSAPSADLDGVLAVARTARDTKRKLDLLYCASDGEPSRRIAHVHQIIESAGRWYVIAWCEKVQDFRRFRAERILEARLLAQDFRRQVLFQPLKDPRELLSADGTVPAQVAFSKKIARWLKEKYPNGREQRDGRMSSRSRWRIPRGSCARFCSMGRRRRCWGRRVCGKR